MGAEERKKDIKKVKSSKKDREFKKKELEHTIRELNTQFYSLSPTERKEKGQTLARDIVDYGFLKEFTKKGHVEVKASEKGNRNERIVNFTALKSKDWDKAQSTGAPK